MESYLHFLLQRMIFFLKNRLDFAGSLCAKSKLLKKHQYVGASKFFKILKHKLQIAITQRNKNQHFFSFFFGEDQKNLLNMISNFFHLIHSKILLTLSFCTDSKLNNFFQTLND